MRRSYHAGHGGHKIANCLNDTVRADIFLSARGV